MQNNWKKINPKSIISSIVLLLLVVTSYAAPNEPQATKGIFDELDYREVLNIKLTFDLEQVFNDRNSQEEYPADLQFKGENGKVQNWQIKLSTRGKFRRMKCQVTPPLRINFKKGDLEAAGLAKFDDLKLVNYCIDDPIEGRELLLKEYLAYKMYNELTEYSYRVQLVNISYVDQKSRVIKRQLGFLIEDTAQLRARVGANKSELERSIDRESFDTEYQKKAALFQYLIGNQDWGLTYSKNIKYIIKNEAIIPVPYDFDFAVMVEAPYAMALNPAGKPSYKEREYLGFERNYIELKLTIESFLEQREALYSIVQNFKLLRSGARKEVIQYLDTFFENYQDIQFPEEVSQVRESE